MCRESAGLATANLDNKTAPVPVKLKRKQINAVRLAMTEMGECAGETTLTQYRDDDSFQRLAHLFACVGHVCVFERANEELSRSRRRQRPDEAEDQRAWLLLFLTTPRMASPVMMPEFSARLAAQKLINRTDCSSCIRTTAKAK